MKREIPKPMGWGTQKPIGPRPIWRYDTLQTTSLLPIAGDITPTVGQQWTLKDQGQLEDTNKWKVGVVTAVDVVMSPYAILVAILENPETKETWRANQRFLNQRYRLLP